MRLQTFLKFAFICTCPLTSYTAVIWQAPQDISGDSDVSLVGELLQAYSFATNSYPNGTDIATINGVQFEAIQVNSTYGYLTLSGFDGADDVFGSSSNPFASLSSPYQVLLSYAAFDDSNTLTPSVLTFTNLEPNTTYQIQIWATDSRAGTHRTEIFNSPGGTNSESVTFRDGTAGALGQYIIGTFTTADGVTSQQITFSTASTQVNAAQLRMIPEPGTFCLLIGAITIFLVFGSRRRHGAI